MKNLWACRNKNDFHVCVTSKKPNWRKVFEYPKWKYEWLFPDSKFWTSMHKDVFKKLIGYSIKEGKEGLRKIPVNKCDLIFKYANRNIKGEWLG